MDPIWSVCGIRSKEIANGAAALALSVDDAMASGKTRGFAYLAEWERMSRSMSVLEFSCAQSNAVRPVTSCRGGSSSRPR